ncbi:hypothetical protein PLESTM_000666900 [Pleodorina starrii]|nr:hypothetical protein PLESTM_000666900 [Pleodorina starrii]
MGRQGISPLVPQPGVQKLRLRNQLCDPWAAQQHHLGVITAGIGAADAAALSAFAGIRVAWSLLDPTVPSIGYRIDAAPDCEPHPGLQDPLVLELLPLPVLSV